MCPTIGVHFYVRLANREEKYSIQEFGDEYLQYMKLTPGWFPKQL
ncbi:TPA: hypothetical protein ACPHUW_002915 [Vibrio alginolyticus]